MFNYSFSIVSNQFQKFIKAVKNILQRISRMNLASFLHSHKQHKQSTLPLPLAPVFILPQQKWYFSSPTLIPLRKKRQNTSLKLFLNNQQLFLCDQILQNNKNPQQGQKLKLLCVYQHHDYYNTQLRHIFQKQLLLIKGTNGKPQTEQKCNCMNNFCNNFETFRTNEVKINEAVKQSSKIKQQWSGKKISINWHDFTKKLIHSGTNKEICNTGQQGLSIYKLPDQVEEKIYHVYWNNQFIYFNRQCQDKLNQRMKSKAVSLCGLVKDLLDKDIWQRINLMVQKNITIVQNKDCLLQIQKGLKVKSFKIWFYKNNQNNEIYILNVSHISLSGVPCLLYPTEPFNSSIPDEIRSMEAQLNNIAKQQESLYQKYQQINQNHDQKKIKLTSETIKSIDQKTLQKFNIQILKQDNPSKKNKIAFQTIQHKYPFSTNLSKQLESQIEYAEIICDCCNNLLMKNEVINQMTASHINQIRYLRQMKEKKHQHHPYDFIKVCSECYNAYLFFQNKKIKAKKKNGRIPPNCPKTQTQPIKIEQVFNRPIKNISVKRIDNHKTLQVRSKSELRKSFKDTEAATEQQSLTNKQKSILGINRSLERPLKSKKLNTTYTTATENTIIHDNFLLRNSKHENNQLDQSERSKQLIERKGLPKSNSLKAKSRKFWNGQQKIINSFAKRQNQQIKIQQKSQSTYFNKQVIKQAISEYEDIKRPSFKRLIYRNYKHYLKRDIAVGQNECQDIQKRKSISSYNFRE